MAFLGLVWLILLVLELTGRATPMVTTAGGVIWGAFVLHFLLEFTVAPKKGRYLRRRWLTVLALALPAVRVVRVLRLFRLARALRGVRLLRTLTSLNRAIASLRATMRRRGFSYVLAMTVIVTIGGAAGMYALERDVADPAGLHDFATALWWTAMMMTTMGSAYWPQTPEGRLLCVFLALYAFGVFGYMTAALATFFVSRDAERSDTPVAGRRAVDDLRAEIAALRTALTHPDRQ